MTIHEGFYTGEMTVTDYMYQEKKRKGASSIEDCVSASFQGFEKYTKTSRENSIQQPVTAK